MNTDALGRKFADFKSRFAHLFSSREEVCDWFFSSSLGLTRLERVLGWCVYSHTMVVVAAVVILLLFLLFSRETLLRWLLFDLYKVGLGWVATD